MEDATIIRSRRRRRPLYTIGFSIISTTQILFKTALETDGPLGSLAEKILIIISPTTQSIHKIQFHFLSILAILDDYALSISNKIESRLPLSTYIFNQMDVLVYTAETLPGKIDNIAVNVVPFVIRHIPFLELMVTLCLKWLIFLIAVAEAAVCALDRQSNHSKKTTRGNATREEKEIRVVDTEALAVDKDGLPLSGRSNDDAYRVEDKLSPLRDEAAGLQGDGDKIATEGSFYYEDDGCSQEDDDPIVHLFEVGWVTPNSVNFITPTQSTSNL